MLLTLTEYSFRLDLDMARRKIEKGVVRYMNIGGSAGNVTSTVDGTFILLFDNFA